MSEHTTLFDDIETPTYDDARTYAENNPNEVESFLHSVVDDNILTFTRGYIVRGSALSSNPAQGILSGAVDAEILTALVNIRCPHCSTDHGKYYTQSAVPDETKVCFNCGDEFDQSDEVAWTVRYEFNTDEE